MNPVPVIRELTVRAGAGWGAATRGRDAVRGCAGRAAGHEGGRANPA